MEDLKEAPSANIENCKSFDMLAVVKLFRFDLETHGRVLPETMNRGLDEELTYIAEGINRPVRTSFNLPQINGEICYFDRGQWRPYMSTLLTGQLIAEREAMHDSRRQFLAERAEQDSQIGYKIVNLKPGETYVWESKFPEKELLLYGEEFVADKGFQVHRKMGFIYRAEKNLDDSLTLESQSVDNCDDDAFEAVADTFRQETSADMETLRAAYDRALGQKYEASFYAGRQILDEVPEQNAWEIIKFHGDLIGHFLKELESLASQITFSEIELERSKKRLTYGMWAALKNRIDAGSLAGFSQNDLDDNQYGEFYLRREIELAYLQAAGKGEELFGCGGVLKGEDAILSAKPEDVLESIFGSSEEVMKCVTCPICNKSGVDAHIHKDTINKTKTITCSECKKSKTYNL